MLVTPWLRRRRSWALAMLLAWASLGLHGLGATDLVRLRNALQFRALPASGFEWTPEQLPEGYLQDRVPAPAWAVEAVRQLELPADDDWARALGLARHLLGRAPQLTGGALKTDLQGTYRAITTEGSGYCADFVRAFEALAGPAGLTLRSWAFAFDGYGGHGHIVIEIWNRSQRRWQVLDLFNNVVFLDAQGQPLSALALREQLRRDGRLPTTQPIEPRARPGFEIPAKLLAYYQRGLDQWFLWWGENPHSYEAARSQRWFGWARPVAQLAAVAEGVQPAPVAVAEPGNAAAREGMRDLRLHLMAVAALSLCGVLALLWPRRSR